MRKLSSSETEEELFLWCIREKITSFSTYCQEGHTNVKNYLEKERNREYFLNTKDEVQGRLSTGIGVYYVQRFT